MLVKDCKDKIKIGDWVKTNGSCMWRDDFFEGYVGEIQESCFCVWQNEKDGNAGSISPSSKGYNYSWKIGFDNLSAEIEILKTSPVV